jgi:hypothetical protein
MDVSFRRYFFGCATGVFGRKPLMPAGPDRLSAA